MRGGYLYQHRPDLFPQGYLTEQEIALWVAYFDMRDEERKAVDPGARR